MLTKRAKMDKIDPTNPVDRDDTLFDEIQREYEKIDGDWLHVHHRTSMLLVLFATIVEVVMGLFLMQSDLLTTSVPMYILKYMLVPMLLNGMLILVSERAVASGRFTQRQKIYTVSLVFTALCLVLYTVHSAFVGTRYIFAIGIMLTCVYADYRVTLVTAASSIASVLFSELALAWDADKVSIFASTHRMSEFVVSIAVLFAFSVACLVSIRFEQRKNQASIQLEIDRKQLKLRLQVDELTGIYNRKALHVALKNVEDDPQGNYVLAVVDIDHFKTINDRFGHHTGDRCLVAVAKVLMRYSEQATPFRYGGDEFCLLFEGKQMQACVAICAQIQQELGTLACDKDPQLKLTASFGLAAYVPEIDAVRLFVCADKALYAAKEVRNAIRVHPAA